MENNIEVLNNLIQEVRRGSIVISVLSQLNGPQYGYSLVQSLGQKGLDIDPGTLYPLLRRLEKQNILESKWETGGTKPRKYYELSDFGKKTYSQLCDEWVEINKTINKLIE